MKLSDAIKYSFIKTIRDKKNIYYIVILVICCLTLTGSFSFMFAFFNNLSKTNDASVSTRSLYVTASKENEKTNPNFLNERVEELKNMEHVLEVGNSTAFITVDVEKFKSPLYDGRIELIYGSENTLPKNIIGDRFSSKDIGVMICPTNFFPGSMESFPKNEKKVFIDGKDLLNNTYEVQKDVYELINNEFVKTGTYKESLKVVGLYEPSEIAGELFQCYISPSEIDKINKNTTEKMYAGNDVEFAYVSPATILVIDEYKNAKEVMSKLIDMGFNVKFVTEQNTSYQNSIKLTCLFIVFVAMVSICLLTILYIKKKTINSFYSLGIMKSLGYENNSIVKANSIQVFLMSIFSFITSTVLFIVIIIIVKNTFDQYLIYTGHNYYFNQSLYTYIISLLIVLFLPTFSSYYYTNKIVKSKTLWLLKGAAK